MKRGRASCHDPHPKRPRGGESGLLEAEEPSLQLYEAKIPGKVWCPMEHHLLKTIIKTMLPGPLIGIILNYADFGADHFVCDKCEMVTHCNSLVTLPGDGGLYAAASFCPPCYQNKCRCCGEAHGLGPSEKSTPWYCYGCRQPYHEACVGMACAVPGMVTYGGYCTNCVFRLTTAGQMRIYQNAPQALL